MDSTAARSAQALATATAMVAACALNDVPRVLDLAREAEDAGTLCEVAVLAASTAGSFLKKWAAAGRTPLSSAIDQLAGATADEIHEITETEEQP